MSLLLRGRLLDDLRQLCRSVMVILSLDQHLQQILPVEVGQFLDDVWELRIRLDELLDDGATHERDLRIAVLQKVQNTLHELLVRPGALGDDRGVERDERWNGPENREPDLAVRIGLDLLGHGDHGVRDAALEVLAVLADDLAHGLPNDALW